MDSRLMVYFTVVAFLPFIGAFINRAAVLLCSVTAALVLSGVALLSTDGTVSLSLWTQLPLLIFWSYISLMVVGRRTSGPLTAGLGSERSSFLELEAKHKELRLKLQRIEREEERSVQIYAVAKGLGESLSWSDMAPRLSVGLKNIFSAYEFLLYAKGQDNSWVQLHRRGSWTKDPPLSEIPTQTCLLKSPKIEEVVPVLNVPIFSETPEGRDLRGVLFVKQTTTDIPDEEIIQTGEAFGEQLSMAINKALLFHQMEISSRTDGLTGVLRRQAFMERLAQEFKRSAVFHTPFSLMMLDIDHFKKVNDSHGHAAGDAVLAKLGDVLKNSIYETDVVGRYGGEEFVILFPKAEPDGVLRKAESLRQKIEQEEIPSGFEKLRITVSMGLAHFPHNGRTLDALIAQSDLALYQAKETGRNRVIQA